MPKNTKTSETQKALNDGWKTVDMEQYAKGNLELAITFLRMCLTQPQIFANVVASMEDHRNQLIQIEEDEKALKKAEKEADLKAHPRG